jgi:hypothetical protein
MNKKTGFAMVLGIAALYTLINLLVEGTVTGKKLVEIVTFSLIAGGIALVSYGWMNKRFNQKMQRKGLTGIKTVAQPGEQLIFSSLANHYKGLEAVGGSLFLTNKRLIFESHSLNIQNHQCVIPLETITGFKKCSTGLVFPNGLLIEAGTGSEKFVVNRRQSWLDHLSGQTPVAVQSA